MTSIFDPLYVRITHFRLRRTIECQRSPVVWTKVIVHARAKTLFSQTVLRAVARGVGP